MTKLVNHFERAFAIATAVFIGCVLAIWLGLACLNKAHAAAECLDEGKDCIDHMNKAGKTAYCTWASGMAAAGAFFRDRGVPAAGLRSTISQPEGHRYLTPQELQHIDYWMRWGHQSGENPYRVREKAYVACMGGQEV